MKKKVLIGFLTEDMSGAIPTVTKAFMDGLEDRYDFVPFYMDRKYSRRKSKFNITNLYYLVKHQISWVRDIIRHRPDIAHFPITSYWNLEKSLLILMTARVMGINTVVGHLHGGAFSEFWNSINPLRRKLAGLALKRLDAFAVLSSYWKGVASDQIGIEESRVFEVNNPIENSFEKEFENFSREYQSNHYNFISISSLAERKGILDSLEALKSSGEDFRYTIVGNEVEEGFVARLKNNIRSGGLEQKVMIRGPRYGADKIKLMKNSDIYLLPSHIENFPLAIIEAACAAMPIIATPVGALPEFFTHMENIYYVAPGKPGEIGEAVEFMTNNPAERERLGRNSRKVFENRLSRENIMKQLDNVYSSSR